MLLARILVIVLVFDFFYLALTLASEFLFEFPIVPGTSIRYSTLGHILLLLIQSSSICSTVLNWSTTYYQFEEDSFISSKGILFKKQSVIYFRNLETVSIKQGVLGRFFGFGDLVLTSLGKKKFIKIPGIENPEDVVKRVSNFSKNLSKGR